MPRPSLPFQCSEEETARLTLLPSRGGATIFFMRTCFDVVLAEGRETEGGGSGEGDQLRAGGWRHTPELRMTCDWLWFWHQSIDCHWPLGDSCSIHSAPPPSPKQNSVWGSEWQFINWAPPRLCTQWDTVPAPTESILWRGREMDIDDHLKKKATQFYWPDKYKSVHTHTRKHSSSDQTNINAYTFIHSLFCPSSHFPLLEN